MARKKSAVAVHWLRIRVRPPISLGPPGCARAGRYGISSQPSELHPASGARTHGPPEKAKTRLR